jgi:tetratricopeptide (TPR) repeat protein
LAIDQAASYIQYRQLPVNQLGEFLDMYEKQRRDVLEHTPDHFWEYGAMHMEGAAQEKAVSAFTTWEMSFQQLCQGEAEREVAVAHFLTLSAFLAPIAVSESIFRHHWESMDSPPEWMHMFTATNDTDSDEEGSRSGIEVEPNHQRHSLSPQNLAPKVNQAFGRPSNKSVWDHDHFWRLISRAHKLSLVQVITPRLEPEGAAFSLHPLIRDWLQLRENGQQRRAFTSESIKIIVNSIRVFKTRRTVASIKQSLLLHVDTSVRNEREFSKVGRRLGEEMNSCNEAKWFAAFYRDQGRYHSSFELEAVVRKTMMDALGKEHQDTLMSTNNLALVLTHQGKYGEADQMHREVLGIRQKVLGMEHPDTLTSMNNLAVLLSDQGKYEEAGQMHREVLRIRQKVLGMEHPDTLTSINNLAALLSDQGKYGEAGQMHREVLRIRQKVLGMEHPQTLTSMNNLATVLSCQGKYEEGGQMHREVLGIIQKVLGMEHPHTLTSMNNLAGVLSDQGTYEEAEQIYREVLESRQKVLGMEHPDTLMSIYDLAKLLSSQSRRVQAAISFERAVAGFTRVLGPNHPTTVACQKDYSSLRLSDTETGVLTETIKEMRK